MKKGTAIMFALLMGGMSSYFPGNVSMAGQEEDVYINEEETNKELSDLETDKKALTETDSKTDEKELSEDDLETDTEKPLENGTQTEESVEDDRKTDTEKRLESGIETEEKSPEDNLTAEKKELSEDVQGMEEDNPVWDAEAVSLQIPQRVGIVIDPWEMDESGQIYSEQYVIRNTGKTAGKLILSNHIYPLEEPSEVVIRTDPSEIHDGDDKLIYMEMALGNGEKAVFSKEGFEYEVRLEAEEALTFWFTGEVNENASNPWKNGDFGVTVTYSWEEEDEKTVLMTASPSNADRKGSPSNADREEEIFFLDDKGKDTNGDEDAKEESGTGFWDQKETFDSDMDRQKSPE